jgi:hypothetical protein
MLSARRKLIQAAAVLALFVSGPFQAQAQTAGRPAVGAGPTRTVAMSYAELSTSDPIVKTMWSSLLSSPRPPTAAAIPIVASVAYVREASGSLLTITMLHAPEWCTTTQCPLKILRDGRELVDTYACSEPTAQRITADGRSFMACGDTIKIPSR